MLSKLLAEPLEYSNTGGGASTARSPWWGDAVNAAPSWLTWRAGPVGSRRCRSSSGSCRNNSQLLNWATPQLALEPRRGLRTSEPAEVEGTCGGSCFWVLVSFYC